MKFKKAAALTMAAAMTLGVHRRNAGIRKTTISTK